LALEVNQNWRPTASMDILRQRAAFIKNIRLFFEQKKVLEVETPLLVSHPNPDAHIEHFSVDLQSGLFLHSSPELAMKRLLAAGSGPIFQISKVFRKNELGRIHHHEFTMLEWYQPDITYHQLMDEVHELLSFVGITRTSIKLTYLDAFMQYSGLDLTQADAETIRRCLDSCSLDLVGFDAADTNTWLDLILAEKVEPYLGQNSATYLYDYPASQAAMARIRDGDFPVAERFELYLEGMEIANGYQELTDYTLLKQRYNRGVMNEARSTYDLDPRFLSAMKFGLPECSGVAIGLDRLFMVCSGCVNIKHVLSL